MWGCVVLLVAITALSHARHVVPNGKRDHRVVAKHHNEKEDPNNPFVQIGLPSNPDPMLVFNALETARLLQPNRDMDLEQDLTNYELALHDALFDYLMDITPNTIDNLRENAAQAGIRRFVEKPMLKEQLVGEDFVCLPPLRVLAEGLQQFDMYSDDGNIISPIDLVRSYRRAFGVEVSEPHAIALIRGLQYNPRAEDAPNLITRCEFVRGYMKQRGYLDSGLIQGISEAYDAEMTLEWSIKDAFEKMSAHVPGKWRRFIKRVFNLDRNSVFLSRSDASLTKCEVTLLVASCRMHTTTHYMAASHPAVIGEKMSDTSNTSKTAHAELTKEQQYTLKIKMARNTTPLNMFEKVTLFPQSDEEISTKRMRAATLLGDLFVGHDFDGDYGLSRREFSMMIKTMDMWQDLALAQIEKAFAKADKGHAEVLGPEQSYVEEIDVDMFIATPLLSSLTREPVLTEKLSLIWDNIKDQAKRVLTMPRVKQMLLRINPRLAGADLEQAAVAIYRSAVPRRNGGRDYNAGLSKKDFFHTVMSIPNFANEYRLGDLETLGGLVSGVKEGYRIEHLKWPYDPVIVRDMYEVMVPIMLIFDEMKKPDVEFNGVSLEGFQKLPKVLPRVKRSADFESPEKIKELWKKYNESPESRMPIYEFAMLFAANEPAEDGMPVVNLRSFALAPRLHVPRDIATLSEADKMNQLQFENSLHKKAAEKKVALTTGVETVDHIDEV